MGLRVAVQPLCSEDLQRLYSIHTLLCILSLASPHAEISVATATHAEAPVVGEGSQRTWGEQNHSETLINRRVCMRRASGVVLSPFLSSCLCMSLAWPTPIILSLPAPFHYVSSKSHTGKGLVTNYKTWQVGPRFSFGNSERCKCKDNCCASRLILSILSCVVSNTSCSKQALNSLPLHCKRLSHCLHSIFWIWTAWTEYHMLGRKLIRHTKSCAWDCYL